MRRCLIRSIVFGLLSAATAPAGAQTYTRAMSASELKNFIASQQALWKPLVQQFAARPQ